MNAKTIRLLSVLGKAAGLTIVIAGPLQTTPAGLIIFAAASFLTDAANRFGDLMDDGKRNESVKG